MTVRKLIEILKDVDQDAEIMLHSHKDLGGSSPLFVVYRTGDPKCVWIEDKGDCDYSYQLSCRFEEKCKDLEFYKDLLDRGVTIEEVKRYVGKEEASKMTDFCKANNLI